VKSQQLELNLWNVISTARLLPEEADLQMVLQILDQTLANLDTTSQLRISADAVCQITDLFCDRTDLLFAEIQAKATDEGPIMPDDAFNRYVRQSMIVDLEQFIQPWENPSRKTSTKAQDHPSVISELDKEALLQYLEQEYQEQEPILTREEEYAQLINIAHQENVSVWIEAIATKLSTNLQPIKFIELEKNLELPRVEIWLGLMLGNFKLEQRSQFYDTGGIWVSI